MKNMNEHTCRQCGKAFMGGPRAWYCPECRIERNKERRRKYNKEGHQRKLGGIDKCVRCGKDYIITNGNQKYCPDCAEEAVKEIDREQGLEWYRENAGTYNPARNEKRRVGTRKCIVCGKEFSCVGNRQICSEECLKLRTKEWQRRADQKRAGRKR